MPWAVTAKPADAVPPAAAKTPTTVDYGWGNKGDSPETADTGGPARLQYLPDSTEGKPAFGAHVLGIITLLAFHAHSLPFIGYPRSLNAPQLIDETSKDYLAGPAPA